jgi:hypothetical protein
MNPSEPEKPLIAYTKEGYSMKTIYDHENSRFLLLIWGKLRNSY